MVNLPFIWGKGISLTTSIASNQLVSNKFIIILENKNYTINCERTNLVFKILSEHFV